jgi:hypothetical protein
MSQWLRGALESAGVDFSAENGRAPGVRRRRKRLNDDTSATAAGPGTQLGRGRRVTVGLPGSGL